MIKAIFTDLDGVIRHWDNQILHAVEASYQLPKGFLVQHAFAKELLFPTVTGQQTHEDWNQQIEAVMRAKIDASIAQHLLSAWNESPWSIDVSILEAFRSVASDAQLMLVMNATDRLNRDLQAAQIAERFDFIINSSEIGFAKPDMRFYEAAMSVAGVGPNEVLYIDDAEENVEAARKLGFRAVLFCDRNQALSELRSLAQSHST